MKQLCEITEKNYTILSQKQCCKVR